jgi:hypothetical protein
MTDLLTTDPVAEVGDRRAGRARTIGTARFVAT